MKEVLISVLVGLIAGFGGGWAYTAMQGGSATTATTSETSTTSSEQSLEDCLAGVWGEEKYAAISANPDLASTEDNLAAIQCYEL